MKFPDAFNQFIHKTPDREEAYLSLVLEESFVQAAVWTIQSGKKPHISESTTERVASDAWDKRIEACDRAIAKLAQKEGRDDFEKVVLGLPAYYLTNEDDIDHAVRAHIKTITEELELTPIGFVPLHQAIVYKTRDEEGVPPSVILLEVSSAETTVILYKVGSVIGRATINNDDAVAGLERTLKGFKDLEVLPSRILLYGSNEEYLETYKRDLLKHPWPTRANFLHYPKIEILPTGVLAGVVSLAGASELATQVGEELKEEKKEVVEVSKPSFVDEHEGDVEETDENLVEVSPETLGFQRDVDILEKPVMKENKAESALETEGGDKSRKFKESINQFITGFKIPTFQTIAIPKAGILMLILILFFAGGAGWLSYWILPKASITIFQLPKTVSSSSAVTVNPIATVVDSATKTVPGKKQEKSVSGEKTIPVTGQKDMGDPARGTVTVYNKSFSTRTFKKGTSIATGSLRFTLDSDITVASKSVNLSRGEETYGQGTASVTAVALGPNGNIPAGKEFSFKDVSSDIASAWNEKAFSGGTSKVVTVVSRADYETLIDALTKDLIEKAKSELSTSVGGHERLIDETVKTTVTQKKFDAELGEETNQLHGSITVTVSGISYNEEDASSLFADLVAASVPSGYTLAKTGERVHATNVQIKKDGSIDLAVEYSGQALPTFDLPAMKTKLAGKTPIQASEELKAIEGVAGIEIGKVSWSLWGKKIPVNKNNILLSVAILE